MFDLPYGQGRREVRIPRANVLGVLSPRRSTRPVDENTVLRAALARPVATPRLRDLAQPGQKVVVVTSDLTRPCPSDQLLPLLLDELNSAGVHDEDVTVVMALGLHRPMEDAEREVTVGPSVYERIRVVNHDVHNTVPVGVTSAGTPVALFRPLVEADLRVCLGNLELHYFAGYSGGAKAIFPGCASEAGVRENHAMMVRPEAAAGRLAANPVRADLEEAAAMVGVDFIYNVVVDGDHRVVAAVSGDVAAAHRRGCDIVDRQAMATIRRRADVVIVSAGGRPKDLNLYQAQKALDNAAAAVRTGGTIILVAECGEGFGNETFREWMLSGAAPDQVLARLQAGFTLGGHKAAAIARVLARADVYFVSSIPAEMVCCSGLVPFHDVSDALHAAILRSGTGAQVLVMPEGGSVLPVVRP